MYFHQPIVYFFFGNNASVIVLTKALGFSMCLGIFLQLSNWVRSGHRAMFVQCSYNGKKKFVQCSYNAPLNFVQYCTNFFLPLYEHCTNFVCTILYINVWWYFKKKHQQTGPHILQGFCYQSGFTLDIDIVSFVLAFLWPDLTCVLYTVPSASSYRSVYQAMQVRPRQPGSFDTIWNQ